MRIDLTDNNNKQVNAGIFHRTDISALFPLADKTIAQLCQANENLLVFPYSLSEADDKVGNSPIMSILNTDDSDKVRIATGNVMGFIGVGNLQVKIKSRFDSGRNDYLLHYMLQKVLSVNLFDLNHNNEREDVFDFVMFMFPHFLRNAMRQGIYREYQNFKHNDANVKGSVDFGRHITRNVPFVGNVAYSTRDYTFDNDMTELIRHTIEFMQSKRYGQAVLNIDRETIENVEAIVEHTPSYCKNERSAVISKNLRHKCHPYYTEYQPLRSLCLQILRREEIRYGETDNEIYGILFDGAWLWEEYVNTLLCHKGFIHPENKKQRGRIDLFEDHTGPRYPDFYKEGIVLDAKYKRLNNYEHVSKVDRNDIHQLIAYVANLKAAKGGFVAPLFKKQSEVPNSKLKNLPSSLFIFGIEVCQSANSYSDFCQQMKENEQEFLRTVECEY